MTTYDKIELPPLRIPDLEDELTAVLCAAIRWGGSVISSEEYVAAKQRFRAAVNAAIEADRKRRGEPVARLVALYDAAKSKYRAECSAYYEGQADAYDMAIQIVESAGPQPAEPVKVPSDGDIMVEWASTPNTGDMRVDLVVFARALLARYGKGAP